MWQGLEALDVDTCEKEMGCREGKVGVVEFV